ncbi:TolC family outer membrane protein [Methylococcus sp. EFPC2]|uniref:TolC family outer membrane protein n=1 Tax=Methylococcus sp. EFPC2 TaxID=2812648 RepID=UPI0019682777|nr:TolC family outer membrane protein [Methylococcus sp. EFPC2]QSA97464.1 TolC family outer membrane protein [Methylococcus sp. EFPC2]
MKLPLALLSAMLVFAMPAASAQDLLAIYDLALQQDPKLREAEETRNAALENKPQSLARLLPTLSASAGLNRNSVLSKFDTGSGQAIIAGGRNIGFWNSNATLNLTQPIYHHDMWVQLSQADNRVAQAEADYAAEQQNLIVRTANAYFGVLLAEDNLSFAHAERTAIERQLDQAKARFEVGLIAITDVNEAQAGFDQARADEIKAENELDNAREALREIIGPYEGNLAGLVQEIPLQTPEPQKLEDWDARAQEGNLTLIAAQNRAEVAQKGIDLQFAGHLPTLDLVGSAGFTDTNRLRGIGQESQIIGMQFKMPLFEGGAVNSKVRQARHEFASAQEAVDRQRRAVTRQVKDAFRGIVSSIGQVKALKAAVVSAQSALEASEAGLQVGTRTMVDVLATQRNLYRTERDYAKTRYDYILANLNLKQAASMLRHEDVELINRWLSRG